MSFAVMSSCRRPPSTCAFLPSFPLAHLFSSVFIALFCSNAARLFVCGSGIGTWRFGSEYDIYGDFETTLQTEFELLFGEFQEGWTDSRDMAAFNVIYLMVIFLLVLNFLLAIIVEAYMKLRQDIEAKQTDQGFMTDLAGSFQGLMYQRQLKWPPSRYLGAELMGWQARSSVGFKDLYTPHMMFSNQKAVGTFLKHYATFGEEMMSPVRVNKFGFTPTQQHFWTYKLGVIEGDETGMQLIRLGAVIESMIKNAHGHVTPSLREELEDAQLLCQERRQIAAERGKAKGAQLKTGLHDSMLTPGLESSDASLLSAAPSTSAPQVLSKRRSLVFRDLKQALAKDDSLALNQSPPISLLPGLPFACLFDHLSSMLARIHPYLPTYLLRTRRIHACLYIYT